MQFKTASVAQILLFILQASTLQARVSPRDDIASVNKLPTRQLGGVTVVDTPLVRAAQEFARNTSTTAVYKHVMRSWLYGVLLAQHNATLRQGTDFEAHAVAAILHDVGWNFNTSIVTADRRFEVDGAFAAVDFVRAHGRASEWDEHRLQLVWDAIALHTTNDIAIWKETTVAVLSNGVATDVLNRQGAITDAEFKAVVKEFPDEDKYDMIRETAVWLSVHKPQTTYDNWIQSFGEHFVANYTSVPHKFFDLIATQLLKR